VSYGLTALIALVVVLVTVLSFYVHQDMEKRLLESMTQTEANRLHARVTQLNTKWTRPLERELSPAMSIWGESGTVSARSLPPSLRLLSTGRHRIRNEESNWYVYIRESMDGRLYVLYDALEHEKRTRQFGYLIIGIGLLIILAGYFAARSVAAWIVSPLQIVTDRITRWVPGVQNAPVQQQDEGRRLIELFNRMQEQIDRSIADQREFTSNFHHEIRHPLAVIRSDTELMLKTEKLGESASWRLKRMIAAVDEIADALESTYGISQTTEMLSAEMNMRDCVDDVCDSLMQEAEKTGLVLRNEVQPSHVEELNRYAVAIVVRNIMRNAIYHAAPAEMRIESIPHGLRFTDSGPGIKDEDIPFIFERYYSKRLADENSLQAGECTPDRQIGLGLAIAKRVCSIQHWRLEAYSRNPGSQGMIFELNFLQSSINH